MAILFSCLAALAFTAGPGEAASPTGGSTSNPHGNYLTNTEQCARCHNTHTGLSARLLKDTSVQRTCYVCHDGTQSYYNVKAGTYWNGTADLSSLGGGFESGSGYTSTHLVDASNKPPGGAGSLLYLTCVNCHNPHGRPSTDNYRMIQKSVQGQAVTVTAVLTRLNGLSSNTDAGAAQTNIFTASNRAPATPDNREIASYLSGISNLCGSCHGDYLIYTSADTDPASGGTVHFRHRVGAPLTGGTPNPDGLVISYNSPGLYTILPTQGVPTGANIRNHTFTSSASGLPLNTTYTYVVTAVNYVDAAGTLGESTIGKAFAVTTPALAGPSGNYYTVTIYWDMIANAIGYKVYRGNGATPASYDLLTAAPLPDNATSYTDTGAAPDTTKHPPGTSNATIMCLTCHYAHGTKASVTALIGGSTKLRRLDNMGVCQNCHKK